MTHNSINDLEDGDCLVGYRVAIVSWLRKARFPICRAEDVADDMVVKLLARMRAGSPFRPHGGNLTDVSKAEAFRRAKEATFEQQIGESELYEIPFSSGQEVDNGQDLSAEAKKLMAVLKACFGGDAVERMIKAVADGEEHLRALAKNAGVSERTFRNMRRRMGVAPRR